MGPPDDETDMDAPVWAGVMPLRLKTGALIRDPDVPEDMLQPLHAVSNRANLLRSWVSLALEIALAFGCI